MTPLRQRFSDDLRLRNKSPRTIEAYVHAVAKFARHYNQSPELLGPDQIRQYQLHLIEQKVSWSQFNQGVCALRFLYNVTLKRPHLVEHLPFAKRPRLLPSVLTRDEVAQLITAALPGRDRTLLETAYSCGLRLQELLGLQVSDIDGARMVLHVRHAKGSKDRLVPLSATLLVQLRAYWQKYRPTTYLFPGLKPGTALHDGTVQRICRCTALRAGLSKRHSSAHAAAFVRDPPARSGRRLVERAEDSGSQPFQNDCQVPAHQPEAFARLAELARWLDSANDHSHTADGGPIMTSDTIERPKLEVADVIRAHGDEFRAKFAAILGDSQRKALRDLARCRTAELGGHVDRCLDCGHERFAYNSCRNRHCPKCQAQARAEWLSRQAEHLLPVEYFHLVFTLPDEVAELAQANPSTMYDLLFTEAAATIREVSANPKRLGAMPGLLLVLHTWGQALMHHPHVHGVVTGGGLSCDASGKLDANPKWVKCRKGFFLPVRVLSRVFPGKYLDGLKQAHKKLRFYGKLTPLANAAAFHAFLSQLYKKEWVVYSKKPFGGPSQVLKYLARYTHRVAISNSRLVSLENGKVSFSYKDYADEHKQKTMTLDACEFLRRFVQHVLPRGFVKMRHYGLLANRFREARLQASRRLLLVEVIAEAVRQSSAEPTELEPPKERCCEKCGSRRLECVPLPKSRNTSWRDARRRKRSTLRPRPSARGECAPIKEFVNQASQEPCVERGGT